MLPLFLNVIGILITSIVLFAGYSWMNSVELKDGAAAIELSDRLRSLQNISGRYYYARGTYPRNLSDLEGEVELPSMAGTDAKLALDSNIACVAMVRNEKNAHILDMVVARVPGAKQGIRCGTVGETNINYVGVSIDGVSSP